MSDDTKGATPRLAVCGCKVAIGSEAVSIVHNCGRAEREELLELLREARDNAQASTAETGISDVRREYRFKLYERLAAALKKAEGHQ